MNSSSLAGPQLISRERAEIILQPYIDILNRCIDEGWNAWKTDYSHKFHILDSRARAANVYCEIAYRAVNAFTPLENVVVKQRTGTLTVFIGEEITLRFKKIGRNGRCSNIKTRTQTLFLAQLQLPGMLDGTLIHAGYQLNEIQQEIVRKAVVCQLDNQVLWQIQLNAPLAGVIPITPVGTLPTPQSQQPRFVAKDHLVVPTETKAQGEKG